MFKKNICKFFFWNFELFVFFFPKKINTNYTLRLNFAARLYSIYNNFDNSLKFKYIVFIMFINFMSLLSYLKFFKNLSLKNKEKLIGNLINLQIGILTKGVLALKSQSIIIFYSIIKKTI